MLSLVALLSAPAAAHADPQLPDGFSKVTLASGLWDPTAFAFAPDGRIFIVEKRGRVAVARPAARRPKTGDRDPDTSPSPATAACSASRVDTDFETNHYVYLLYTYDDGSALQGPEDRAADADQGRRPTTPSNAGEVVLLGSIGDAPCPAPANDVDCIPSTSNSHSIGTVRADPDGTLWVG